MEARYRTSADRAIENDGLRARGATSMWRCSPERTVVWCRSQAVWAQVRRWSFARAYADTFVDGKVAERAFTIPRRHEDWVAKRLDVTARSKRPSTPNQARYHDELRARAARGELFVRHADQNDVLADSSVREPAAGPQEEATLDRCRTARYRDPSNAATDTLQGVQRSRDSVLRSRAADVAR